MSAAPTLSVIMPVYNGERFITAAIESVRQQSLTDWELLIVDDGSTDGTAAIVRAHTHDPRLTLIQQPNQGPAPARNRAIAAATAPYVAFLDADDVWFPGYLEAVKTALDSHPEVVLAFTGWQHLDAAGRLLPQGLVTPASQAERVRADLDWRDPMIPSGVTVRRRALEAAGGFDPSIFGCDDWDLWLRLRPLGGFVAVPQVLVGYRTHGENMSSNIERTERERFKVYEKHLGPASPSGPAPPEQQRAVAGYLYFNSAMAYFHAHNLEAATAKLQQAIDLRPALLDSDELYYELACAFQPTGYRGSAVGLRLNDSARLVRELLYRQLRLPAGQSPHLLWGRACLVFAQVAYAAGQSTASLRYAGQAVWRAPARRRGAALRAMVRAAVPRPVARAVRSLRSGPHGQRPNP